MAQTPDTPIGEQPLPTLRPTDLDKSTQKKNVLLPAVIIFIVVLLAVGAILIFSPKTQVSSPADQALNKELEKGKILLAKQIAKVGNEILYGKDLSFYFYQIDRPSFTKTSEQEVKNTILATLVEQSIVLQAAQKMNLVKLSNDVFNNLDKNQTKRIQLFNQAYAALQEQESTYSGEVISIWYYNQRAPSIPLAQAEQTAKTKLQALQTQVATGTLTMQQAAEKIAQDSSLSQIDGNYKANAYYSFTDRPLPETSSLPQAQTVIANLKEGEVSEVIQIKDDTNKASDNRQELFAVIKLTKKNPGKIANFNTWLESEKKQYPVKVY